MEKDIDSNYSLLISTTTQLTKSTLNQHSRLCQKCYVNTRSTLKTLTISALQTSAILTKPTLSKH